VQDEIEQFHCGFVGRKMPLDRQNRRSNQPPPLFDMTLSPWHGFEIKMAVSLGLVSQQYPCLRPGKHFGLLMWVGEKPGRLVALSGILPIFLGPVHLASSPVIYGALI
jgi:hypothetical protein